MNQDFNFETTPTDVSLLLLHEDVLLLLLLILFVNVLVDVGVSNKLDAPAVSKEEDDELFSKDVGD